MYRFREFLGSEPLKSIYSVFKGAVDIIKVLRVVQKQGLTVEQIGQILIMFLLLQCNKVFS